MTPVMTVEGSPTTRVMVRNPWGVLGLTVITLGIYQFYWWYQINRELAAVGRRWNTTELGERPDRSLLAMIPGSLVIVPAVMTLYGGLQRVKALQRYTGAVTMNGWVIVALMVSSIILVVPALFVPMYFQFQLNQAWMSGRVPLTPPSPDQLRPPIATPLAPSPHSGTPPPVGSRWVPKGVAWSFNRPAASADARPPASAPSLPRPGSRPRPPAAAAPSPAAVAPPAAEPPHPPPGRYSDPGRSDHQRYWDGHGWTADVR